MPDLSPPACGPGTVLAFPRPLLATLRQAHGAVAPLVLLPLAITVFTGTSYRLLRDWGGLGRDQAHWLMVLHEGEWLGHAAEPFYVLLNGLGLLWMLITGGVMLSQRWLKRAAVKTPAP
jgi:hypothetical protein